jgi:hypothetical protein
MVEQEWFIPGRGWDTESVVYGYIKLSSHGLLQAARSAIRQFEFDEVFPFTNIFWSDSPASYNYPVIGFAGSYKQVEEAWNEWLWRFSQLLSRLDAVEARVSLACVLGHYEWKLEPAARYRQQRGVAVAAPLTGQQWGITEAPANDFSIHPEWLEHFPAGADQVVERWPKA